MALSSLQFISPSFLSSSSPSSAIKIQPWVGRENQWRLNLSIKAQGLSQSNGSGRRVWRRRKLSKKDDMSVYKMERIPFLEEQVNKIREAGKILTRDIEKLLLSEENRYDFVNAVAAEANEYVEKNRDEYGAKKAILHVLSNRMNEAGFHRPDAYLEPDVYKPVRGIKHELI